ncbi:MAG: 4Fe-4S binding protein [Synechococcaceae cyanobacterium]|nr:4Fe-4S binding protein [Synechococcaceae cyanobacterium]
MLLRLQVSERLAHWLRWLLLLGWLLLIVSLFLPHDEVLGPMQGFVAPCVPGLACQLHDHDGNRLFWGVVVPVGLLIIVAVSHEAWRRMCPLAFVSQIFRALGWQRTVIGRGGRREVAKISPDSWIGRHHLNVQWLLLVVGLVLRLLVVNSHPLGLALLLLSTLVAALSVGWAYGGKAWCQYFCPMGPVQLILAGPRSATGHLCSSSD